MADLPRYELPNPGLPLGQQAVSPVAQTNPLQSLAQGAVQGGSLGLQSHALQIQQQQQIVQQQQAAAAIAAQRQKNLMDYSSQLDTNLKNIADIDHGMAVRFYKEKVLPFHNAIGQQYGLPSMDPEAINSEDNTPKELERVSTLYHTMISDPQKAPLAQAELNDIFTKEIYNKKLSEAAGSALKGGVDFNKHQDDLEQQFAQEISATKSRSGGYGQQDQKVDQAAHLRTMVNQYHDPKTGNYNVPQAQYTELVMGLANLLSPTGTADAETREKLESMTSKGKFNQAVQYITGKPQTGNTQAIIKNLVDSIDRQGMVAQNLRDNYLSQIQANQSLEPERAVRQLEKGRGAKFTDYLPGGKNGPQEKPATPEAYLTSIHAKVTPKNIEWAKSQMAANGK